jgi:hypothetical protein
MNQTLEEAPETGRVKKSSHHPSPQRPLLCPGTAVSRLDSWTV